MFKGFIFPFEAHSPRLFLSCSWYGKREREDRWKKGWPDQYDRQTYLSLKKVKSWNWRKVWGCTNECVVFCMEWAGRKREGTDWTVVPADDRFQQIHCPSEIQISSVLRTCQSPSAEWIQSEIQSNARGGAWTQQLISGACWGQDHTRG